MSKWRKQFGIWVPDKRLSDERGFISPAFIGTVAGSRRRKAGIAYAFTETFEGSNADSQSQVGCDNTGWVSSNSANNPHYATGTAPLVGSYSLGIFNAARTYTHDLPTAGSPAGMYCRLKWAGTQASSGTNVLALLDSSSNILCRLYQFGATSYRIYQGTVTSGTPGVALSTGTEYHVWLDYVASTGANDGICRLYISSNATKPGSANITVSTGTATANAAKVRFYALSNDSCFDSLVADGTQVIGSDPL